MSPVCWCMDDLRYRARDQRNNASPAEKSLWNLLRQRPLGLKFRRRHVVAPFILDFYCPALKLAIEVDGDGHESQREYDDARDVLLEREGITVLRVGNYEARFDPGSIIEHLERALRERSAEPRQS